MSAVSVEGLTKVYRLPPKGRTKEQREVRALDAVDLEVAPGTALGIIGANGAGKSTLLKVLSRVTPPTSGRAVVRGRVVPLLELGGAFQADATGRENVLLNAALYGIPRAVANRRMDDIFAFADLEDFADVNVARYSSGMYLRLAFSVAVNMEPDVLLADEVLAVGDLSFQEKCLRRVEEAGREGVTVLFVSHDLHAIRRLCDRVVWLHRGRIVADGDPEEVTARYEDDTWATLAQAPQGAHAAGPVTLRATELVTGDGDVVGALDVATPAAIRLSLDVAEGGLELRPAVLLSTDGVTAFRSVAPEPLRVAEAGRYVADVAIPGHLLNDSVYVVKSAVTVLRAGTEEVLVAPNALSFRVYDGHEASSARGSYRGPLTGAVRPRLDWSLASAPDAGTRPGTAS